MTRRLLHGLKAALERSCGITIARRTPVQPNQHADEALRRIRPWTAADVVFDVGANDGRTVLRLDAPLGHPRIFAFEPVSSTYDTLVQRTSHMPNVRTFQLALGARSGAAEIYLSPIPAMNSLSPTWTREPVGTETVALLTIDEIMTREGIDFIDFLKIDTEGYELEVLQGAESALRNSRIAVLQVEVGFDQMADKGFATLEEVRCHLAARGLRLYGIYNQCRTGGIPPTGWAAERRARFDARVLAYCDALFIRADLASGRKAA